MAVIGAGNMAREHLRAFGAIPYVSLTGIHSRTRSKAEQLAAKFDVLTVCDSIAELYESSQADLVVVAVSETAVESVGLECFEFPWTVLLEKPPGLDVAEAERMNSAANDRNRMALVALNRRFLSSTMTVLADLESLEGPRHISVQDQEDQVQAKALGHPPDVVRNWMYANSIHLIDYFRLFGRGKITRVSPAFPWNPTAPRLVAATIEFESGDTGMYEAVWNAPGPWAVSVTTSEKRWELKPLETASFQLSGQRKSVLLPPDQRDSDFKPGFKAQADSAVVAAMGGPSDCPSLADGLETMRLIQSIYAGS